MAKGAIWMILFRLADRSIGVISTLILARLLIPADFGLVAMAMSIVAALEILSAFSFDLALIQNRSAERKHYDTAWTFNVLFGLLNACILLALADTAASFYNEPRVENIMRWLALYAALQGFTNIGIVAFQKDLELHKEVRLGILRKLIGFSVTISLAFALRDYWALVAGQIASVIAGVALSYRLHPYRPRFTLAARKDLFRFSAWMLVNNVLIFLMHRTTDLVLGRSAGAQALGTYSIAYEISNLPTTELVFPISRAVFPGYSKMAASVEDLRRAFLDVLSVILLFVVPAGLGIAVLAEPLVYGLLGEKWKEAIPLIQVLAIFGVLRAASSNSGAVYLALGIPRVLTYVTLLFLTLMGAGLWLLVPAHGAAGAALAMLIAAAIQVPVGFVVVASRLGLSPASLLGVFWRPLAGGLIMAIALVLTQHQLASLGVGHVVQLLALGPLGLGLYPASVLMLWRLAGRPNGGETYLMPLGSAFLSRFKQRLA